MTEQLQLDFDKIIKTSNFSKKDIDFKKNYLEKFIEGGFPSRKQENWKFLDISQIIKKNIKNLSFFNDYWLPNKIDSSIFVDNKYLSKSSESKECRSDFSLKVRAKNALYNLELILPLIS